jgi:hypothetical protein
MIAIFIFKNRMSSLPAHLEAGVEAQGDLSVGVSQFLVVTGGRRSDEKKPTNFSSNSYSREKGDFKFICWFLEKAIAELKN